MTTQLEEFQAHVTRFTQSQLSDTDLLTEHAMGLAGETGELVDLLKKHLFMGYEFDRAKFVLEMGDCLFYWVAIFQRLGFGEILPIAYQDCLRVVDTQQIIHRHPASLSFSLSLYSGNASQLLDCYIFSKPINLKPLENEVMRTFNYYLETWLLLLKTFNVSPDEAMQTNIAKLEARHEGQTFDRATAIKNKLTEVK